ncbi:MAG TPA: hypothetical protein VFE82_05105 [Ramlibacter sp.]|jgi:hypothetical protein|uniref:hypothetical protein n=1 Tax=Ramlibacter sp. TaxID=1917967 RepID=UPI002D2E850F|nr:hypothetical protein [Ramlibacter sp.]HZY17837.1 hypothetical protein [Ramlibacter sp.]
MTRMHPLLGRIPNGVVFATAGGRGGAYTCRVRDAGRGWAVAFVRASGTTKRVSEARFLAFWTLWRAGVRELRASRNQSGERTPAAAACYLLPLFEWLSRHDMPSPAPAN